MTTPGKVVNDYTHKPFELYFMRGKQFTIIESLTRDTDLREIEEINKWNKKAKSFFIKIEEGLFQKDLKLSETELEALFLVIPKATTNYAGVVIEVDQNYMLSRKLKYMGTSQQDSNGNLFAGKEHHAIPNNGTPINPLVDQAKANIEKLIGDMTTVSKLGIVLNQNQMEMIANIITPGQGKELVDKAKQLGYIIESSGVYRVP